MIIDFHSHVVSPRIKKNREKYIADDPCFAMLYSHPEARLATAKDLIAGMDENGVDVSVIANYGWATHELCVETNDYILESIARYPERLIGFCSVQMNSCDAALDEIERCVRGGIKGVGEIRPDMQKLDLGNDLLVKPFVELMQKHKLVLLTHASEPLGHDYPGKGTITPDVLYKFIAAFPDLPVVCAHWGGGLPFYALMPEVKRAMRNVFFDTAASPFLYSSQIYAQVIQLVGAERVLFGTDYPLLSQSRMLNEINSLGLPEVAKRKILSGNALKLLGIEA